LSRSKSHMRHSLKVKKIKRWQTYFDENMMGFLIQSTFSKSKVLLSRFLSKLQSFHPLSIFFRGPNLNSSFSNHNYYSHFWRSPRVAHRVPFASNPGSSKGFGISLFNLSRNFPSYDILQERSHCSN
jgi:hypothetical protein